MTGPLFILRRFYAKASVLKAVRMPEGSEKDSNGTPCKTQEETRRKARGVISRRRDASYSTSSARVAVSSWNSLQAPFQRHGWVWCSVSGVTCQRECWFGSKCGRKRSWKLMVPFEKNQGSWIIHFYSDLYKSYIQSRLNDHIFRDRQQWRFSPREHPLHARISPVMTMWWWRMQWCIEIGLRNNQSLQKLHVFMFFRVTSMIFRRRCRCFWLPQAL